ncbi:hypothetical protein LEP3755_65120 (plasmid) [Leptolyngbya sp. NIES-3755]|nr:hypothetical protein LEP3755_65120 [Leptolyngbya sp. NIES-3755]
MRTNTMRICPLCIVELGVTERQGIEIDYCPQCRGIWLDRGELEKIIDRSVSTAYRGQADREDNCYRDDYRDSYYDNGHHQSGHHDRHSNRHHDSHYDRGHHADERYDRHHGGGHHGGRRRSFLHHLFDL